MAGQSSQELAAGSQIVDDECRSFAGDAALSFQVGGGTEELLPLQMLFHNLTQCPYFFAQLCRAPGGFA